jgi:hypothetical protein
MTEQHTHAGPHAHDTGHDRDHLEHEHTHVHDGTEHSHPHLHQGDVLADHTHAHA